MGSRSLEWKEHFRNTYRSDIRRSVLRSTRTEARLRDVSKMLLPFRSLRAKIGKLKPREVRVFVLGQIGSKYLGLLGRGFR